MRTKTRPLTISGTQVDGSGVSSVRSAKDAARLSEDVDGRLSLAEASRPYCGTSGSTNDGRMDRGLRQHHRMPKFTRSFWRTTIGRRPLEIDAAEFALLDSSIQATCSDFLACPPEIVHR